MVNIISLPPDIILDMPAKSASAAAQCPLAGSSGDEDISSNSNGLDQPLSQMPARNILQVEQNATMSSPVGETCLQKLNEIAELKDGIAERTPRHEQHPGPTRLKHQGQSANDSTQFIFYKPRRWADMSVFHVCRAFCTVAIQYYGDFGCTTIPFNPRLDRIVVHAEQLVCEGSKSPMFGYGVSCYPSLRTHKEALAWKGSVLKIHSRRTQNATSSPKPFSLVQVARLEEEEGWLKSVLDMEKRDHNRKGVWASPPETVEDGINSFVYRARRPFSSQRLFELIHDKFVIRQPDEEKDDYHGGSSNCVRVGELKSEISKLESHTSKIESYNVELQMQIEDLEAGDTGIREVESSTHDGTDYEYCTVSNIDASPDIDVAAANELVASPSEMRHSPESTRQSRAEPTTWNKASKRRCYHQAARFSAKGQDIQDLVGKEVRGIDGEGNLLGEDDTVIGKVDIAPEGSIAQRIKDEVPEAADRLNALDEVKQAAPIQIPSFAPTVLPLYIQARTNPCTRPYHPEFMVHESTLAQLYKYEFLRTYMIWRAAVHAQDRVVHMRSPPKTSMYIARAPCPPIFLVCKESKRETEKSYQPLSPSRPQPAHLPTCYQSTPTRSIHLARYRRKGSQRPGPRTDQETDDEEMTDKETTDEMIIDETLLPDGFTELQLFVPVVSSRNFQLWHRTGGLRKRRQTRRHMAAPQTTNNYGGKFRRAQGACYAVSGSNNIYSMLGYQIWSRDIEASESGNCTRQAIDICLVLLKEAQDEIIAVRDTIFESSRKTYKCIDARKMLERMRDHVIEFSKTTQGNRMRAAFESTGLQFWSVECEDIRLSCPVRLANIQTSKRRISMR
ncbi:Uu.00g134370.m01.CDS01 [Anthostomella pinea]|uniref:Uu.00g134370.m01.CDS01 n=1 Tax=Anthostomella pinea TaxID=933095 RepID=A0AAI8VPV8_9PEZI|nr:Uu.00g134370.m01.CDS01 [Anthostomella pinea]